MRRLIAQNGWRLEISPNRINRERLLGALCWVESRGWHNRQPNFEPAFYSGRYANFELTNRWSAGADPELRELMGRLTASSLGPWQIMYPVAVELGFSGSPMELADPRVNVEYAVRYINRRAIPGLSASDEKGLVAEIADAYNSGSHRDLNVPHNYISRILKAYHDPTLFDRCVTLPPEQRYGPPPAEKTS